MSNANEIWFHLDTGLGKPSTFGHLLAMDDVRIASLLEKFFKFFELLLRKCGPIPPLERIFQKEITFISIYERCSNNVEDEFPLKKYTLYLFVKQYFSSRKYNDTFDFDFEVEVCSCRKKIHLKLLVCQQNAWITYFFHFLILVTIATMTTTSSDSNSIKGNWRYLSSATGHVVFHQCGVDVTEPSHQVRVEVADDTVEPIGSDGGRRGSR